MTVVGIPFYNNLGPHWPLTIMACISVLLTPLPYLFYKYGYLIRKKSRYAHYAEAELPQQEQQQEQPEKAQTPNENGEMKKETEGIQDTSGSETEADAGAEEKEIPGVL